MVGHNKGAMEHAGAIPAKLFDYFLACRPILVVGPSDCEAGKIVMRTNRGLAVSDDDAAGIAAAVDRLRHQEGASGSLDLSLDGVSDFEAAVSVERLAIFFTSVLRRLEDRT